MKLALQPTALIFYRFPIDLIPSAAAGRMLLAERAATNRLRDLGPLELSTSGFVPVFGRSEDSLAEMEGEWIVVSVGTRSKQVPGQVLQRQLDERIREIETNQSRVVGARERRTIKDEITTQLLPRAFEKEQTTRAWINPSRGWCAVDTSSRVRAEVVISEVRGALGRFPAVPVATQQSLQRLFTDALSLGRPGGPFTLGDACVIRGGETGEAKWVGRDTDLESDEVKQHIAAGGTVEALGLSLDERISFLLTDEVVVQRIHVFDVGGEQASLEEDRLAALRADLAILSGLIARMVEALDEWCEFEPAPVRKAAA